MKLEHAAINVADPIGLAQWLAEHLGLRVVVANTTGTLTHFLADEAGSMIELYNNPIAPMPDYSAVNPYNLHFAFTTSDIDADRDRLIAAGATAIGEMTVTPSGDRLIFLRAPGNVPIQLTQRKTPLV
jgi:glyoxylase I family protein